ncbi:MAG: hypothetical protein FAF03_10000 [Epsilonproteobacteria bacterium]|nr:hypothetical protein [Campylobacterota bacterium]
MRKAINANDEVALQTYAEWKQEQIEKAKVEEDKNRIDTFDYSLLIGLSIGEKTIERIVDAGSTIHLFFEDGTDDYSQSKKSLYDWYQLKLEETA